MFKRCAQIQSNWNVRNLCENKLDMCTKSGGGQWKNYSKFEYANELNWPRWRRRPWTRDPCSGGEAGDWGTRPEVEWRRREPQSASTGAAWAWAWVAPSDDTDRRLPCDCCPFWRLDRPTESPLLQICTGCDFSLFPANFAFESTIFTCSGHFCYF